MPDTARMVTVAEAARMIERSVSTLARWRKSRSGPSFLKWPGRYGAVHYNEADIIAWCHHRDHARSVH